MRKQTRHRTGKQAGRPSQPYAAMLKLQPQQSSAQRCKWRGPNLVPPPALALCLPTRKPYCLMSAKCIGIRPHVIRSIDHWPARLSRGRVSAEGEKTRPPFVVAKFDMAPVCCGSRGLFLWPCRSSGGWRPRIIFTRVVCVVAAAPNAHGRGPEGPRCRPDAVGQV